MLINSLWKTHNKIFFPKGCGKVILFNNLRVEKKSLRL